MNGTHPVAARELPLRPCRRPRWRRICRPADRPIARDVGIYRRSELFRGVRR